MTWRARENSARLAAHRDRPRVDGVLGAAVFAWACLRRSLALSGSLALSAEPCDLYEPRIHAKRDREVDVAEVFHGRSPSSTTTPSDRACSKQCAACSPGRSVRKYVCSPRST